jgi:hypothetical protein
MSRLTERRIEWGFRVLVIALSALWLLKSPLETASTTEPSVTAGTIRLVGTP